MYVTALASYVGSVMFMGSVMFSSATSGRLLHLVPRIRRSTQKMYDFFWVLYYVLNDSKYWGKFETFFTSDLDNRAN
jgi:hypothetical protein